MQHTASVPWQEQHDPFLAQISLLSSWFLGLLVKSRLRTPDWRSRRKTALLSIVEQFTLHRETWLGSELRQALEYLLETFIRLLADPQAVEAFDWPSLTYMEVGRKVGRFPRTGQPSLSAGANAYEAYELDRVRTAACRAGTAFYSSPDRGDHFGHDFSSGAGVTILKMRRLQPAARDKLVAELEQLAVRVPERVRLLEEHELPPTAANVLPSPAATLLWAHDACEPSSSRLARFNAHVQTLLLLYSHAVALERVPSSALPPLEACAHELAHGPGPVEEAFGAKPLAVQVSLVDYARNVVFTACEAFVNEGAMRDGKAVARDLGAAFHGVAPPAHGAAHEPLVQQSLGVDRARGRREVGAAPSEFFPEARRGAW